MNPEHPLARDACSVVDMDVWRVLASFSPNARAEAAPLLASWTVEDWRAFRCLREERSALKAMAAVNDRKAVRDMPDPGGDRLLFEARAALASMLDQMTS